MQRQVERTGDFGIGLMIHSVHMADDVPILNAFYEEVSGLLAADPGDTFGAPYSFTTEDIPGDPFDE